MKIVIFISFDLKILQSTRAQAVVTTANVCAMIFVIITGTYLGFKTGWIGYELPTGYLSTLSIFILSFIIFKLLLNLHVMYFILFYFFALQVFSLWG